MMADAQPIPAEVREGFILLEKDIHDRIEQELQTLDSLREVNRELESRVRQLQESLNNQSQQVEEVQRLLNQNDQAIAQQLYELRATIKLLKIELRDQKAIMHKYARRRLTDNQKKGLGLLGIMSIIVGGWIALDVITN
jgi:predicted RNase H-like nuclease (RuvC/YqgF family)